MLLMSIWLGRTLLIWARHVRGIEAALGGAGPAGMPAVTRTGERELDRIIDALNDAGARLAEARLQSDAMSARVARAERLAGLGRVAAGVASQIRNPLAAARLQGENALAGDDTRRRLAIGEMLSQIDRLDTLVGELLAMTQRVAARPVKVTLQAFLAEQAARHETTAAAARGITLTVRPAEGSAWLDPTVVGRILDNLLTNAIRHASPGGRVILNAERGEGRLAITVEDSGAGVAPEMAERLFSLSSAAAPTAPASASPSPGNWPRRMAASWCCAARRRRSGSGLRLGTAPGGATSRGPGYPSPRS